MIHGHGSLCAVSRVAARQENETKLAGRESSRQIVMQQNFSQQLLCCVCITEKIQFKIVSLFLPLKHSYIFLVI